MALIQLEMNQQQVVIAKHSDSKVVNSNVMDESASSGPNGAPLAVAPVQYDGVIGAL